jgi:NADPH:quinone reductase
MTAILVREFIAPEVLKLEEIPTPQPAAGHALVRVNAAGVNPSDTSMRMGTYAIKPPRPDAPCRDAAGTIESVGTGVTRVKIRRTRLHCPHAERSLRRVRFGSRIATGSPSGAQR